MLNVRLGGDKSNIAMGHIHGLFTVLSIACSVVLTDGAATVTGFNQSVAAHATVTSNLTSGTVAATTITVAENFDTGTITTFTAIYTGTPTKTGTWTSSNTTVAAINSTTGVVTVPTASLDYEKAQLLTINLTFTDTGLTSTCKITLTLNVTDVNDNAPIFNPPTYTNTVENASAAGTVATTVTATDSDGSPPNNFITYSISAGNTSDDWTINGTGAIAVAAGKQLSKTRTPSYTLIVLAIDNGIPKLNGTATVTITVGDVKNSAGGIGGILVTGICGVVVMLFIM